MKAYFNSLKSVNARLAKLGIRLDVRKDGDYLTILATKGGKVKEMSNYNSYDDLTEEFLDIECRLTTEYYIVSYVGLSDNDPDANGYCEVKVFDNHAEAADMMETWLLNELEEQKDNSPHVERGKDMAKVSWSGGSESIILRIHKENIF